MLEYAATESFFTTLKNRLHYRERFHTWAMGRFAVAEYIKILYP